MKLLETTLDLTFSGFFVLFSINAYWVQTMLEAKQVVKLAVSSVILADDFDKKKSMESSI